MKTTSLNTSWLQALTGILLIFALHGCKERINGELGEPFDKVAGMAGTWELVSFIQKDLNNPIKEERDLSQFYIVDGITPMRLSFTASDKSFEVAITEGRNFFGDNGTWYFDNDEYPTQVFLAGESDTSAFELGSVVRTFDQTLELELPRGCDLGTADESRTVVYRFTFNRVNE